MRCSACKSSTLVCLRSGPVVQRFAFAVECKKPLARRNRHFACLHRSAHTWQPRRSYKFSL